MKLDFHHYFQSLTSICPKLSPEKSLSYDRRSYPNPIGPETDVLFFQYLPTCLFKGIMVTMIIPKKEIGFTFEGKGDR